MQITIQDRIWELENKESSLQELFDKVNAHLAGSDNFFSHFTIDGVDVYEDYVPYMQERIGEITSIVVEVRNRRQLADESVESLAAYLERAVPSLQKLIDDFYRQPDEDSWLGFNQLLEGLVWMQQAMESWKANEIDYKRRADFDKLAAALRDNMNLLSEPLQAKDFTLLGDLLQYEMLPVLEQLQPLVKETLDNEVAQNDSN